ncbi:MAG: hypothetical protein IID40_05425 [Planctomycetes bacterium]|nr:hypothetical protein [Planctomycetota bacterium]
MRPIHHRPHVWCLLCTAALTAGMARAADDRPAGAGAAGTVPDDDVVLAALIAELDRSADLQLEDLEKPYFIRFEVEDSTVYRLAASDGALTAVQRDRRRSFASRIRVGSYDLDNTNFTGGRRGGRRTRLPLEDDLTALRQAIWSATDRDYKAAIENLTRKRAYLEQKNIEDRPVDFIRRDPTVHLEPPVDFDFDEAVWTQRIKRVSARFKAYPDIQTSAVGLVAAGGTNYLVTSEGTRLRVSDTAALVTLTAQMQAADGMRLSDERMLAAYTLDELPSEEELLAEVDRLCRGLADIAAAPILEQYTGPVLFDSRAAGQLFASLLARGLAGQPEPIGVQRSYSDDSLDKKIGKRILPRSFDVYDDPTVKHFAEQMLFGWYEYDDEAVPTGRVDLVEKGYLKTLVMGRAPTKKLTGSTGHGRSVRFGAAPQAVIANLFVSSSEGLEPDQLKAELIEACKDEDLEFGLRIGAVDGVSWSGLSDPLHVFKVYVEDGREERVRGLEFKPVEVRALRRILAAGKTPEVYNYLQGAPSAIIAPAVLMEELELSKIEQELDRLPILKSPATRQGT